MSDGTGTVVTTVPATSASTSSTTTSSTSSTSTSTTTSTTLRPLTVAEVTAAFQARCDELQASGDVHGIGFALAAGDQVVSDGSAGSQASGGPLASTAPFRVASISKVLTATVVLQLVAEGRFALDDTLGGVWPGGLPPLADPRVADITVRDLLQHTSGIGPLRDQFFGTAATDWRTAALVALGSTLDTTPGTRYRYSNANYVVLGLLVERLLGDTIDRVTRERVLTPLAVTTATFLTATAPPAPDGPPYAVNPARRYIPALGPAGAWQMSPTDMVRVMAALQPGSATPLLPVDLLAEMRRSRTPADDEPTFDYGLGLMVFPAFAGHTGTIEDARAFALMLPNGYSVTVLAATTRIPGGEELIEAFAGPLMQLATLAPAG